MNVNVKYVYKYYNTPKNTDTEKCGRHDGRVKSKMNRISMHP